MITNNNILDGRAYFQQNFIIYLIYKHINTDKPQIGLMLMTQLIKKIQFRMRLLHKLKHLVKMNDFFYSSQMLRYQDEMEYRTLTGGLVSMAIIITILVGFANMILDTLDLKSITTTMEVIKQQTPSLATLSTAPDSNFMFAVEILGLNLSSPLRFFDLTLREYQMSYGYVINTTDIPLQTCTRQHWKQLPYPSQNFDQIRAGEWLCPPINLNFDIEGKFSSQAYSQLIFQLYPCNNSTEPSRPCASTQQIDQLFSQHDSTFYFDIYFTNPLINSGQKEYKSYYLEDKSYSMFGTNIGSETYLYFTDYTITTDYSIWPFQNIVEDKGCIVETLAVNHPYERKANSPYVYFSLSKSDNSLIYNRTVQKISSVFSFMGGMIGAVSAVLFIIKIYTSVAFEISIALEIFQPGEKSGVSQGGFGMNFFNFIKLSAYKVGQIAGKPCEWPAMAYVEQCQAEILKQLDIKSLLKRIIFIEYCLTYLFQDYQLDALQLKRPRSPGQIRKIREKCESIIDEQSDQPNEVQQQSDLSLHSELNSPKLNSITIKKAPIHPTSISYFNQEKLNGRSARPLCSDVQPDQIIKIETINRICSPTVMENLQKRRGVRNSNKQSKKRESNLQFLHEKAEKGDPISNKIWRDLGNKIQQQVFQQQDK